MGGIGVGVDQADGDGLDILFQELVDGALDILAARCPFHDTVGVDAFIDNLTQIAVYQCRWFLPREIIETWHAQGSDLQNIAETGRGDQADPRALQFQDRVRGDGGAMPNFVNVLGANAGVGEDLGNALDDGARVVVDTGGDFLGVKPTLGVQENDVGESAADIDADAKHAHIRIPIRLYYCAA